MDNYYQDLIEYTRDLQEESERHIRLVLSEDELELFDLLTKEKMTQDEEQKVRLAAQQLIRRLREEEPKVLVQDWCRDSHSKELVRKAMEVVLDKYLPETYDRVLFIQKRDLAFDSMLNYAYQGRKWLSA